MDSASSPERPSGWRPHDPSRRRSRGRKGELSVQLTASDIMDLAVNVVQNGWDCREAWRELLGLEPTEASLTEPRRRGGGQGPDAVLTMLKEIYGEMLRSLHRQAADASARTPADQDQI